MQIEDYAVIGDTQTVALISATGSIDWLCFPRFDSGACFSALFVIALPPEEISSPAPAVVWQADRTGEAAISASNAKAIERFLRMSIFLV